MGASRRFHIKNHKTKNVCPILPQCCLPAPISAARLGFFKDLIISDISPMGHGYLFTKLGRLSKKNKTKRITYHVYVYVSLQEILLGMRWSWTSTTSCLSNVLAYTIMLHSLSVPLS